MDKTPQKTFSILMCAYNEEHNIGTIISDIFKQHIPADWKMSEYLVVSDNSTDNTDQIVAEKQKIYPKLRLLRQIERRGKIGILNKVFKTITSDYCFIIDSDIRLTDGLFEKFLNKANLSYDLIAGNQQPLQQDAQSLAARAEFFSCKLMSIIATKHPFYGFDGKLLLASRKLTHQIVMPSNVNEDRYLYLFAKHMGFMTIRIPSAIFYFQTTQNISDYIEQRRRNQGLSKMTRKMIGSSFFNKETKVKRHALLAYIIAETKKDLFGAVIWIIYTSISTIWFAITYYILGLKSNQHWKMLKSTKNLG